MVIVLFAFCAAFGFVFANFHYFFLENTLFTAVCLYFFCGVGLPISILVIAEIRPREFVSTMFLAKAES